MTTITQLLLAVAQKSPKVKIAALCDLFPFSLDLKLAALSHALSRQLMKY